MVLSLLSRLIKFRPGPRELPPALFDTDFYLHNNPDVRGTGLTAWQHYCTIGAAQNRKPRADFDPLYYSSTYVDVVAGGIDPFLHYARRGWAEGRPAVPPAPPPPPPPQPARYQLRNIVVGSTNVCNASCIHCPTNKPLTGHLGQGAMSQSTFERIVDQIADRCDILGWASFGLYGDGLVDPLLVERASYFRKRIPHLTLSVATNGAAYSRLRHARLPELLDGITVHVESVNPAKYNTLMAPLRFENVRAKLDQIVEDFRGKVFVAIPWHRANDDDRQEIADYFLARGVREVNFIGLSNRCSMHKEFEQLAFSPFPHPCRANVMADLVFDWDGAVFPCCSDFERLHPIGNLATSTLDEVMTSVERCAFESKLAHGQWDQLPTCSKCKWDSPGAYRATLL